MTIPINPVQIRPDFVERQQVSPELKLLMQALQHRQQVDIQRAELKRQFEQLELNKKLAGPQAEAMALDNEKKKRDLREHEEDLVAQDQALQIYTGNLPRLGDAAGIGEVIAGIKDPRVAKHFYMLLGEGIKTYNDVTPNYQFREGVDPKSPTGVGVMGFDPQNPTKPVRTGVAAEPRPTEQRRVPVVTEREKASVAVMTATANSTINRLEAGDSTIPGRLASRLKKSRAVVGSFLKRIAGVSAEDLAILQEQQIEANLQDDPQLLEYYQAQKAYLGPTLFGLSGKVVTGRDYTTQAPTFFAMGASNPATLAARRKARAQRTRSFAIEAGDAMAERMAELANPEEYGFGTVRLPDGTDVPVTPGRARYHPQFSRDSTQVRP